MAKVKLTITGIRVEKFEFTHGNNDNQFLNYFNFERNIVFQYKADQGDCKKCMGTKKSDKLEVYVRGTENVDWEGRDPGQCGVKIVR